MPFIRTFSGTPLAVALAAAFSSAASASYDLPMYAYDGSLYAVLNVYEPGEISDPDGEFKSRTMNPGEPARLQLAFDYFSQILGPAKSVPNIALYLSGEQDDNASASSNVFDDGQTALQKNVLGTVTADEDGDPLTEITIDLPSASSSWTWNSLSVLPENGMEADLPGTMVHELMHAYGLASNFAYSETGFLSNFDVHLVDVYGNQINEGMSVKDVIAVNPDTVDLDDSKKGGFYVMNASSSSSGVKFVGDNVTEVIGKDAVIYFADEPIIDENGLIDADISNSVTGGLPINGMEGDEPELSHIELQNSLMSHQMYRNWQTLMEAELAVLQDIGYDFDRKRFFGTSIYSSGGEHEIMQAFTARENYEWLNSTASTQSWAVGTHVYGSLNTITIKADQLADGSESIGVRVDGQQNSITVASGTLISANGSNGKGILFAYGRDHSLTIEEGASVQATGDSGKALVFSFGSNEMGDYYEYRGSYILANKFDAEWEIGGEWNYSGKEQSPEYRPDALDGSLMESVVISGTIDAGTSGQAIYISDNAHVASIEVGANAQIIGDIVSEWNAKSTAEEYEDEEDGSEFTLWVAESSKYDGVYAIADEDTDLTTNLSFRGATYSGNVWGADGIRITIGGGDEEAAVTTLSGQYAVLGVTVDANAELRGAGTYILAEELSDSELNDPDIAQARVNDADFRQGRMFNNGTVVSTKKTGEVTIYGGYWGDSESTLVLGFSNEGQVSGLKLTGEYSQGSEAGEMATVYVVPDISWYADGTSYAISDLSGYAFLNINEDGSVNGPAVGTKYEYAFYEGDLLDDLSSTLSFAVEGDVLTVNRTKTYSELMTEPVSGWQGDILSILDRSADTASTAGAQTLIAQLDFTTDSTVLPQVLNALGGDAHLHAVQGHFALEKMVDRAVDLGKLDYRRGDRSVWAVPFGGRAKEQSSRASYHIKAAGVAAGMNFREGDRQFGWHLAGATFSNEDYGDGKTTGEAIWIGGSYADKLAEGSIWGYDLTGRIGFTDAKTERTVTLPYGRYHQSVDGFWWSGALTGRVGPEFALFEKGYVRPYAGMSYGYLHTSSEHEDNVGGLSISANSYHTLRAKAGVAAAVQLSSPVSGYAWNASIDTGYSRELLSDAGDFKAGIYGMNGSFERSVTLGEKNQWTAGARIELETASGFRAGLSIDGEFPAGGGSAIMGSARVSWAF